MSEPAAPDTPAPSIEDQSVEGGPPKIRPNEPYFGVVHPPGGKLATVPPPPAGFTIDRPGESAGKPKAPDVPPPPQGYKLDAPPKGTSLAEVGSNLVARGGMEDDIDYDTGATALAKIKVKDADNPAEAKDALENLYGKDNAGQDKGGRWWIRDKGKKIAVFGGGQGLKTALSEGLYGMAAAAPETAGALGGAAVGVPGGPIGMAVGAALGGAAGAGLDEFRKWLMGEQEKTIGQTGGKIATAGLANAAMEAGGQAMGAAVRGGQSLWRSKFFKPTPESSAVTRSLLAHGARPPMSTVGPEAESLQYKQNKRNLVKGDPQLENNMRVSMQRLHDLMVLAGIPDEEVEEVFMSIIDPRRAVSVRAEGEIITNAVAEHIAAMEREAEASLATAQGIADEQKNALTSNARGGEAEGVHGAFSEAAQLARRQWGAAMTRAYDDIDDMVGGAPIIPTKMMMNAAKTVLQYMPASNVPTIFHEMAELTGNITIKKAQRFRTRLYEQGDSGNLSPGTVNHDYNEVADSVGASLDPEGPGRHGKWGTPKKALEALARVDAEYAKGIAKFRDAKLNQMIRDFKNQKVLEPEKFAASLFDTQSTFRVNAYRQIVGPDVWKKVQAADTRNMIRNALKRTPEGDEARTISGDALDDALAARGQMLDVIYDKPTADAWRLMAKRLRALGGSIDKRIFNDPISDPSRFTMHLVQAIAQRSALENFVASDTLRVLRKATPQQIDAAVNVLTRPGQEAALESVIKTFGEESAPVTAIRRGALKLALGSIMERSEAGIETRASGAALDKFLSPYTREEQKMLFPNGLDVDMRVVADELKALFPDKAPDIAASMAAGSIKGGVPFNIISDIKWLESSFSGWLADRKMIIRAIANINGPPGIVKQIRQQAMRVAFRHFMNEQVQARTSTAQRAP